MISAIKRVSRRNCEYRLVQGSSDPANDALHELDPATFHGLRLRVRLLESEAVEKKLEAGNTSEFFGSWSKL